ncbi:hypothetical protein ZWY2020_018539 [Hordeum vulgare]|nr:hypothetical protein ZWY2020_018539 [Hordeum vulgare]
MSSPSEKIMGGFLSRILLLVFGYAYPAYECYKTVELNKPEIEQLIFWCQYWLPFYSEAKPLFFIYLWYPRTKHENEIDRNLLELRARASDVVVIYVQKVAAVGQNTFFDVLKYVASQSPSQKSKQQRSQKAASQSVTIFTNKLRHIRYLLRKRRAGYVGTSAK